MKQSKIAFCELSWFNNKGIAYDSYGILYVTLIRIHGIRTFVKSNLNIIQSKPYRTDLNRSSYYSKIAIKIEETSLHG